MTQSVQGHGRPGKSMWQKDERSTASDTAQSSWKEWLMETQPSYLTVMNLLVALTASVDLG